MSTWAVRLAVLALAAAVVVPLGACKSKSKKKTAAAAAINGLEAFPVGTRVVVGVSVEKLAASRLVRRGVVAMLAQDTELKARVEGIMDECKLEPGENVESLLVGLGRGASDLLLVVKGSFEENALTACVQKRLTDGGGRLSTKPMEGRTTYRADGGAGEEPVWFALGSPTTLILAGSEAWMAKGLGQGPRLTSDPEARSMLESAPSDAAVWATGWVPDEVTAGLGEATHGVVKGPLKMNAQLDFNEGIVVSLSATMATDRDANALKLLTETQKNGMVAVAQRWGLGRLLAKLTVSTEGKRLILGITADEKELSELLAAVDSATADTQNPPSSDPADAGSPPTPATPADAQPVTPERKN